MKATYRNSFCMDHNCINNFEDSCMAALSEKGTEIEPFTKEIRDSKECKKFIAGTFLAYIIDLGEDEQVEITYKIATKYKYSGKKVIVKPGDIFDKSSTVGYESVEGVEVSLDDLGKLYIAVDSMLYDFSNQWEQGMNPYEFMKDVMEIMKNININNLDKGDR